MRKLIILLLSVLFVLTSCVSEEISEVSQNSVSSAIQSEVSATSEISKEVSEEESLLDEESEVSSADTSVPDEVSNEPEVSKPDETSKDPEASEPDETSNDPEVSEPDETSKESNASEPDETSKIPEHVEHSYYAGACLECGMEDPSHTRIYSTKNTISISVPTEWLEKCAIMYADFFVATISYDNHITFTMPEMEYTEMIVPRVLQFEVVPNEQAGSFDELWHKEFGGDFYVTTLEEQGFKYIEVCSNDSYTVFCQYIYVREYATGTEEQLEFMNLLLDNKQEIIDSVRFE